jgi:5-methylcytosine-specific restriction endonuclease McrA
MKPTLLLSSWYLPHKVIDWQSALTLLYLGKADVVVAYSETVSSPSTTIKVPAVMRLKKPIRSRTKGFKFSRTNVYLRDGYRCQYCGEKKKFSELNYDHVMPRSRGGRTDWDNIVASCYPCNERKASRTCDEAGMWPLVAPRRPEKLPYSPPIIDVETAPDEWEGYLT